MSKRIGLAAAGLVVLVVGILLVLRARQSDAPPSQGVVAQPSPSTGRPGAFPPGPLPSRTGVPSQRPTGPAGEPEVIEPRGTPPVPVVLLDREGRPTINGLPVDPSSEAYRKLVPPDVKLPTRADVDRVIEKLRPIAEECMRKVPADKRPSSFDMALHFRGGEAPAANARTPFAEPAVHRCFREQVSEGGASESLLVLSGRGRWAWNVPQKFEAPR